MEELKKELLEMFDVIEPNEKKADVVIELIKSHELVLWKGLKCIYEKEREEINDAIKNAKINHRPYSEVLVMRTCLEYANRSIDRIDKRISEINTPIN